MEEKGFWDRHSLEFLEMAYSRDHMERLTQPNGYGTRTGDCGDSVEFFIMARAGVLNRIAFGVNGCIHTTACCNTVIHLTEGQPVEAAWEVTPEKVADFLKTLPDDHFHCAELAVGGFYLALTDLRNHGNFKSR